MTHEALMQVALRLAEENVRSGSGGPFAALVVKDGAVIARGANHVTTQNDPTAHGEVVAIRAACEALGTYQLTGCSLYTSCEPCPMCLGAVYWARLDRVYYAATHAEAAAAGFDDSFIYDELALARDARSVPFVPVLRSEGGRPFEAWRRYEARVEY